MTEPISDPEEVRRWLSGLAPRGQGRVRSDKIGKVTAHWDGPNLVVNVEEAHGPFALVLPDARPVNWVAYHEQEDESAEAVRASVADTIARATMTLNDDATEFHVNASNFLGSWGGTIACRGAYVEPGPARDDDGSCRVCGSTKFTLFAFGAAPVTSTGPRAFTRSGETYLTLETSSARIECASCQTPHPAAGLLGDFTLDGTQVG